jgi:hypothetical protein
MATALYPYGARTIIAVFCDVWWASGRGLPEANSALFDRLV